MAGSLRWNIVGGIIGFLVTGIASSMTNPLSTSFVRGIIAGTIWFLAVFAFRWFVNTLLQPNHDRKLNEDTEQQAPEIARGQNVDYTTPDEQDLHDLLKTSPVDNSSLTAQPDQAAEFRPMTPPKLVSKPPLNDEQLAQAVRHLTQK